MAYTRRKGETANHGRLILEVDLTTYEWMDLGVKGKRELILGLSLELLCEY